MRGVHEEVRDHLDELRLVAAHGGHRAVVDREARPRADLVAREGRRALDDAVHVHGPHRLVSRSTHPTQIAHEPRDPRRALRGLPEHLEPFGPAASLWGVDELGEQELEVPGDDGERVVDLVREARRQRPHRRHALGERDASAQLGLFGDGGRDGEVRGGAAGEQDRRRVQLEQATTDGLDRRRLGAASDDARDVSDEAPAMLGAQVLDEPRRRLARARLPGERVPARAVHAQHPGRGVEHDEARGDRLEHRQGARLALGQLPREPIERVALDAQLGRGRRQLPLVANAHARVAEAHEHLIRTGAGRERDVDRNPVAVAIERGEVGPVAHRPRHGRRLVLLTQTLVHPSQRLGQEDLDGSADDLRRSVPEQGEHALVRVDHLPAARADEDRVGELVEQRHEARWSVTPLRRHRPRCLPSARTRASLASLRGSAGTCLIIADNA